MATESVAVARLHVQEGARLAKGFVLLAISPARPLTGVGVVVNDVVEVVLGLCVLGDGFLDLFHCIPIVIIRVTWVIDSNDNSDDNPNEDGNQNVNADHFTAMTRTFFDLSHFDLFCLSVGDIIEFSFSLIDVLLVDLCSLSRCLFSMGIFLLHWYNNFFTGNLVLLNHFYTYLFLFDLTQI